MPTYYLSLFKVPTKVVVEKWIWRFLMKQNSLWHKLIDSKYYVDIIENGWPKSIQYASYRSPWRFISLTVDVVVNRSHRCMGNGRSTLFWVDFWLSCGVLAIVFPRLYCLSTHSKLLVADAWFASSDAWI